MLTPCVTNTNVTAPPCNRYGLLPTTAINGNLEVVACELCGIARSYQHQDPGEKAVVASLINTEPFFIMSDNPETITAVPAAPLWRHDESQAASWRGPKTFRIFVYHVNGLTATDQDLKIGF